MKIYIICLQRLLDTAGIRTGPRMVWLRGNGGEARCGGRRSYGSVAPECREGCQTIGHPHFGRHYARDGERAGARGEGEYPPKEFEHTRNLRPIYRLNLHSWLQSAHYSSRTFFVFLLVFIYFFKIVIYRIYTVIHFATTFDCCFLSLVFDLFHHESLSGKFNSKIII